MYSHKRFIFSTFDFVFFVDFTVLMDQCHFKAMSNNLNGIKFIQ